MVAGQSATSDSLGACLIESMGAMSWTGAPWRSSWGMTCGRSWVSFGNRCDGSKHPRGHESRWNTRVRWFFRYEPSPTRRAGPAALALQEEGYRLCANPNLDRAHDFKM